MDDKTDLFEILKQWREKSISQNRFYSLLEQEILVLSQSLPFKGRILVQGKTYAGLVKLLKLEKGGKRLEFEIEDIVPEGEEKGKIYHKHVAVDELIDIQKF